MSQVKGIKWKNETYEFLPPGALEGYDTSEQVNAKIATAVNGLISDDAVDGKIEEALKPYYNKDQVDKKFNNYTGPSGMAVPEDDDGKFYAMIEKTKEGEPTSVVNVEYLESKLTNIGGGGSGGSVDLSNYYTKDAIGKFDNEADDFSDTNTLINAIKAYVNGQIGVIVEGSY